MASSRKDVEQVDAQRIGDKSNDTPSDSESTIDNKIPDTLLPATVYVVTEIWLPVPPDDTIGINSVGVQILAIFTDRTEANEYAQAHIKQLEELTKKEREDEEDPRDWECARPREEDPFSGRYQEAKEVRVYEDDDDDRKVQWGNRATTVQVRAERLYAKADDAPLKEPVYYPTADNQPKMEFSPYPGTQE